MGPRNTRKTIQDLQKLCKKRGIEFVVVPSRGNGSHQAFLFHDPVTDEKISVVVPSHKDLSPGVQRAIMKYVVTVKDAANFARAIATIAKVVHDIFEEIFRS